MMSKIKLSYVLLLSCCLLGSCKMIDDSTNNNGGNNPIVKKINYEDFYQKPTNSVALKSGVTCYLASDGFRDSLIQGHNHFYYEYKNGNNYVRLDVDQSKKVFSKDGVSIDNGFMKGTISYSPTYSFIAPTTGQVNIRLNPRLYEGAIATIYVYKNTTLLTSKELTKESCYIETSTYLNQSDNVRFVVEGEAYVYLNPEIDYNEKENSLHNSVEGYYGDVHPYYDEKSGNVYMFYLSTGGNREFGYTQQFQSCLTVASDMFHYEPDVCQMTNSLRDRPEQDLYFVLNVFKDKDGKYRSSQGGNLKCCTSASDNLHTWVSGTSPSMDGEGNIKWQYVVPFGSSVVSGRDPDTYYDSTSGLYYTVVLNYMTNAGANGQKQLNLYISDDKGFYSGEYTKLIDFTSRGDPECPQIKKIGNRWYIFYSVYGSGCKGNVGKPAYRVGPENITPDKVNWESLPELYLDGDDLHAAQVFNIGEKYYIYGWLHYAFNSNVWGGMLNIPHEVYQKEDGTLGVKLDEYLLGLLRKGLIHQTDSINSQLNIANVKRNLIEATLTSADSYIKIGNYDIKLETRNNKKYLVVTNGNYNNSLLVQDSNEYKVVISKDTNLMDISINDDCVMSVMSDLFDTSVLSFIPNGHEIKDIKVSKLANLDNIYY